MNNPAVEFLEKQLEKLLEILNINEVGHYGIENSYKASLEKIDRLTKEIQSIKDAIAILKT